MLLTESKWTQMFFGEGQASLSFSHLHKDDEGLYTLRIVSRGGVSEHSAFLFVRGERGPGGEEAPWRPCARPARPGPPSGPRPLSQAGREVLGHGLGGHRLRRRGD